MYVPISLSSREPAQLGDLTVPENSRPIVVRKNGENFLPGVGDEILHHLPGL